MSEPGQKDRDAAARVWFESTPGTEVERIAQALAAAREEIYQERSKTVAEIQRAERARIIGVLREWATERQRGKSCAHSWNEPCAMCDLLARLDEMERG